MKQNQRKRKKQQKMRRITQKTFQQLQWQKMESYWEQFHKFQNLRMMKDTLQKNTWTQNKNRTQELSMKGIGKEQMDQISNKLKLIQQYMHLIEQSERDPVLRKMRGSPFPSDVYFRFYHDLQCLKTIQALLRHTQRKQQSQTISQAVEETKAKIFKLPNRNEVRQKAKDTYQKYQKADPQYIQKQQFNSMPSKCETMSADELEEIIYDLDDLNIKYTLSLDDEQNQNRMQESNKIIPPPQPTVVDKLQQLEQQLKSLLQSSQYSTDNQKYIRETFIL